VLLKYLILPSWSQFEFRDTAAAACFAKFVINRAYSDLTMIKITYIMIYHSSYMAAIELDQSCWSNTIVE